MHANMQTICRYIQVGLGSVYLGRSIYTGIRHSKSHYGCRDDGHSPSSRSNINPTYQPSFMYHWRCLPVRISFSHPPEYIRGTGSWGSISPQWTWQALPCNSSPLDHANLIPRRSCPCLSEPLRKATPPSMNLGNWLPRANCDSRSMCSFPALVILWPPWSLGGEFKFLNR